MPLVAEFNPQLNTFLEEHQTIRALPESSVRVMRMTRDPNCNTTQLLKLIEQDAALSARIMKAVNSSFYALETRIVRLDRAVAYMGLRAVKEVTIASTLATLCKSEPLGQYTTRDLWDHSVAVAILSRELAARSKIAEPEDIFLAGMLHDVGLLLAVQSETEKSRNLINAAASGTFKFTDVEQSVFGFDHAELGQRFAESWQFPEFVTAVARWHHQPENAPEEFKSVCQLVCIADTQCCKAAIGFPLTCATQEVSDTALDQANLARETLDEVTAKLPLLLRLHLT